MTLQNKIIIGLAYTALVFAVGRYTAQKPQIQETVQQSKSEDKKVETKKTITETKRPDGTTTTVTVVDQTITDQKKDKSSALVAIQPVNRPLNLSILAGDNYSEPFKPVYGLSVTKQILGPVTVGVFGLQNKTVGVSVGVNF